MKKIAVFNFVGVISAETIWFAQELIKLDVKIYASLLTYVYLRNQGLDVSPLTQGIIPDLYVVDTPQLNAGLDCKNVNWEHIKLLSELLPRAHESRIISSKDHYKRILAKMRESSELRREDFLWGAHSLACYLAQFYHDVSSFYLIAIPKKEE